MSERANRLAIGWLAFIGVGIGVVVAVILDRTMMEGMGNRPVIFAAITAGVAILWVAAFRIVISPKAAEAPQSNSSRPE